MPVANGNLQRGSSLLVGLLDTPDISLEVSKEALRLSH